MMSVDEKLAVNKFHVDENHPHITVLANPDPAELRKLIRACPAGLYRLDEGVLHFDYAGCLECGTCRILCGRTIITEWAYPQGGCGIDYRYG